MNVGPTPADADNVLRPVRAQGLKGTGRVMTHIVVSSL